MRIAIVGNGSTATDSEGKCYINQHTARFLYEMADSGFHISFIQPMEVFRMNENLHNCVLSNSVESIPIDRSQLLVLFRTFLSAFIRIISADFVYIFYPGTFPMLVSRLCMAICKPFGLYLRGEQFSTSGRGGEIFRRAKFITTVSSSLGKSIGQFNSRVVPIRPMLDITGEDSIKRDFLSWSSPSWKLLFVGRLEVAKGVLELIEAARILESRGFPFNLSLVGGGPLYDELLSHYGNDPSSPIRILGPIRDKLVLMTVYESSDLFVLPTHHEGFPRVLYEAMIKSMVIFTTFVGGIPGLMSDGVNCVEIPVKSPEAIADSIERITRNKALMQLLSENGLETFLRVLNTNPTHVEAVNEQLNA